MRTFKLIHDQEEFHLLDGESEEEGCRTVTLLAACDKVPGFENSPHLVIPTDKGHRVAVARWIDGRVEPLLDSIPDRIETFKAVIKKYLEDCLAGDSARGVTYYYQRQGNDFVYTISQSHPHGLAVKIYSRKELAAEQAPKTEGGPVETFETRDLRELLSRAANEGYAGAVLDERDPIYFCLDRNEALHFLRLSQNRDDEIEETLLGTRGEWSTPFGELDLEIVEDQDLCDKIMVRRLGDIPFHRGQDAKDTEPMEFCAIEKANEPGCLMGFELEDDSAPGGAHSMAAIFFDRRSALEFMAGRTQGDFDIVDVDDLGTLLKNADRDNLTVFLEPGNHRSATGIFWLNGDEVILDSFSGFWKIDRSNTFVHLS